MLRPIAIPIATPDLPWIGQDCGQISDFMKREEKSGLLIAVVGCDGSGKSTLTADLMTHYGYVHAVRTVYLGLGSGAIGNWIKQWPVIGRYLEKHLANKAKRTRTQGDKIPGFGTALVAYLFSQLRLHRFKRMLALRAQGLSILTDRYPQVEVPGFYDGPLLSAARAAGPVVRWLAQRERQLYAWMASHPPDLVIRLVVDFPTAVARKPDHDPELLRQKIAATGQIHFANARLVEIDARQPYDQVRDQALAAIAAVEAETGRKIAR